MKEWYTSQDFKIWKILSQKTGESSILPIILPRFYTYVGLQHQTITINQKCVVRIGANEMFEWVVKSMATDGVTLNQENKRFENLQHGNNEKNCGRSSVCYKW